MSLGSSADIIPFTRFLECRQQLERLGVAHDTSVTPVSTDVGIRPEVTETRTMTVARRRSVSTVHPAMPHGDTAIV